MNQFAKKLFFGLFTAIFVLSAAPAFAYFPSLSISGGGGGNATITVSGASPNSSVSLTYTVAGSNMPTTVNNFGVTDNNGYFSTIVNSSSYGLNSGAQLYVTVGGQQSNTASLGFGSGCSYGNCGGNLSLSQTSVNLSVGQSFGIIVSNGGNNLYISSNSNPSAVSAGVVGNIVNVSGLSNGNGTISVCSNSFSACASIYVTVGSGYGNNTGNLTFSPQNPNLNVGQGMNVSILGSAYSGGYYMTGNSNSNVATASVSGNTMYLQGLNAGSTTMTVCQNTSYSNCGSLYVTVGGGGYGYGSLSLSQTNVSLSVNQSATVSVNNSAGYNVYISSNSNPSVVNATVSGQIIYLNALSSGTSNLTVCSAYNSQCANLYVTVGNVAGASNYAVSIRDNYFTPNSITIPAGSSVTWTNLGTMNHTVTADNANFDSGSLSVGNTFNWVFNTPGTYRYYCRFHGGPGGSGMSGTITVTGGAIAGGLSFSNQSPSLNVGQSISISASAPYFYSGSYYISNNSNSSVVSATISGGSNTINLYGLSGGSTTINVCQNSAPNSCGNLYVTVNGSSGGYGNITLSQTSLTLNASQSATVNIYNGGNYYGGNYYISQNSNSSVATASVSGSTLYVYGQSSGTTTITVCQNGNVSSCAALYVIVSGGYNYGNYGNLTLSQTSLTLGVNQNNTVTIYNSGGYYSGAYYISSNSNSNAATASISGNSVYVYGQNSGSTTISVCQNGYTSSCVSLYVTVLGSGSSGYGYGSNNLNFTGTSLPGAAAGQYYSVQLQVVGGNPPYTYTLSSGSLPAGLTLNSMGQIFGTPQNSSPSSFSVMAMDASGRSVTANFNLTFGGGSSVLGLSTFSDGTLIAENGTVYIVYKNAKTGFASAGAFLGLGFRFSQVVSVVNSGLSDSGYTVTTANAAHPWGSWIKSGQTIYFVHDQGLIAIPSWSVFLSNGGQANLIVPANTHDFQLPLLSSMTMNDSRLQ